MKPDWKSEILFCEDDSETLKPIQRLLRQITDTQASDSNDQLVDFNKLKEIVECLHHSSTRRLIRRKKLSNNKVSLSSTKGTSSTTAHASTL